MVKIKISSLAKEEDRLKRNQREKKRTRRMNDAFKVLGSAIPAPPPDGKAGKIEVLEGATEYIGFLSEVVKNPRNHQWLFEGREHMDVKEIFKIWKSYRYIDNRQQQQMVPDYYNPLYLNVLPTPDNTPQNTPAVNYHNHP